MGTAEHRYTHPLCFVDVDHYNVGVLVVRSVSAEDHREGVLAVWADRELRSTWRVGQ